MPVSNLSRSARTRRLEGLFGALGALTAAILTGWAIWAGWALMGAGQVAEVEILPGQGTAEIARAMSAGGVRVPAWVFRLAGRLGAHERSFKPGIYRIDERLVLRDLMRKLERGDVLLVEVRLIEGTTWRQFRAALAGTSGLRARTQSLDDAQLMAALGAPGVAPEGQFMPDTYIVPKGSDDLRVLGLARRAMQQRLEAAWAGRAADLPLASRDDLLVLASIVEKETGLPADRSRVAGVFINRLRRGMRLQTDPSVIYGLGERFDGRLHRRDLEADGAFNTYRRAGLPPTPICMPGAAAIAAAARPDESPALYFVARGDGSSEFSETLEAHNRAVARYVLGR